MARRDWGGFGEVAACVYGEGCLIVRGARYKNLHERFLLTISVLALERVTLLFGKDPCRLAGLVHIEKRDYVVQILRLTAFAQDDIS